MIRKYIIVADDSIKGFDEGIAKLEREWGAEEIEPSEDCIRREKTLNKINELLAEYIPLMPIGWTLPLNIAKTINELPSVTPQQTSWIPCSERLPEENGNYLVTVEANDGTAQLKYQMVDHYGPKWLLDKKKEKVVAWMPLPEPYQSND